MVTLNSKELSGSLAPDRDASRIAEVGAPAKRLRIAPDVLAFTIDAVRENFIRLGDRGAALHAGLAQTIPRTVLRDGVVARERPSAVVRAIDARLRGGLGTNVPSKPSPEEEVARGISEEDEEPLGRVDAHEQVSPTLDRLVDAVPEPAGQLSAQRVGVPPAPKDDLPEKIDYGRTQPGSRPVLVIALSGAAGGGNESLAALTRSLGGRMYLSTSDQQLEEALAAINRFQQEHPDGIVIILAYSYGGRALRTNIAGRTKRPIDIAVLFDPYSGGDETMSFAPGSIKRGYNYYQRNETDSPWYWPTGGKNPFRGSRVTNAEFENVDLTGKTAGKRSGAKIGHNSIVNDVENEDEFKGTLDRALRR